MNVTSRNEAIFKAFNLRDINRLKLRFNPASNGRLRWIGGNLGLGRNEICEHVIDDKGNQLFFSLEILLNRIYEFEGYRGDMTIKKYLLQHCKESYENDMLIDSDKLAFENFVYKQNILRR
ncbi:MAG: hypothetical protein V4629_00300 [Pseudomonadota bacterium]